MVFIDAITFNHDSGAATHDALNLRRNASEWVTVPEWRRGFCVTPEDSPAAYALKSVQGHTISIQAALSTTDPTLTTAEIRAVDNVVHRSGSSGCLWILWFLLGWLIRALFGNVLGEVQKRAVTFTAGQTGFLPYTLIHSRLGTARVGLHTTEWRWQYRRSPTDQWTDIAVTRHRIYTVLEVPSAPWQQAPYAVGNSQLPWTEVLDYACTWASGAGDAVAAAAGVTRGVYDLGPGVITYDCPGGGSSHYSSGGFDCTAFLERLAGGTGNGYYVNCSDCATFVSSFANILGCDLWQSQMGWFFALNPLLGIGSNVWQPACGWASFSYHEVAWTGACGAGDKVFDSCLQVDSDANPSAAPHTALLPVNLRFGNPGDMDYRDRLATPAGSPSCAPQPATQTRRMVS